MSEIKSHKITPDVLRREYVRIASVQQQLAALVGHEKATQLYAQTLGHIFASARKGKQQPEPVWVDKGKQQPGTPVLSTHDAASKRQQLLVKAAPRQQQQQSDLDINRDLLHQRPMPSTLSTELQQIGRWGVRVHVSHTNVQPTDRLFMRFVADSRHPKQIAALCPSLDVLLSPCSYATSGAIFVLKPAAVRESKDEKTPTLPLRVFEGMKASLRTVVQRQASPHSVLFLAWAWLTTVDSWLHVLRLYSSAFAADDKASDEYKFNEYKFNQQTGSFEPPQWSRQCQRLLEHIVQHPHSEPFRLPLNWRAFGLDNYRYYVPDPMDLATVQTKLELGLYEDVEQFAGDVLHKTLYRALAYECSRTRDASSEPFVSTTKALFHWVQIELVRLQKGCNNAMHDDNAMDTAGG